jgi:type VI protein secretion system component VasF
VLYSAQLRRHLDAVEEALESAGKSTGSAQALRYLLEALPGITV